MRIIKIKNSSYFWLVEFDHVQGDTNVPSNRLVTRKRSRPLNSFKCACNKAYANLVDISERLSQTRREPRRTRHSHKAGIRC